MQKFADLCHLLSFYRIWCKQAHIKKGTTKVNANACLVQAMKDLRCKRFKKYFSIPNSFKQPYWQIILIIFYVFSKVLHVFL